MSRQTLGKSLISFVLVASAVVSVAVDWNTSHVYVITWLVPEASLNAHIHEAVPQVGSVAVYPNVVVATISLALNALGYGLYRSARRPA